MSFIKIKPKAYVDDGIGITTRGDVSVDLADKDDFSERMINIEIHEYGGTQSALSMNMKEAERVRDKLTKLLK